MRELREDFNIMGKERIRKSVRILLIGAIIVFSFLVWYKQFSFRTIFYYDLKPEVEEEKCGTTLTYDGECFQYTESRSFVCQWYKTPYYILSLVNGTDEKVVYQIDNVSATTSDLEQVKGCLYPGE